MWVCGTRRLSADRNCRGGAATRLAQFLADNLLEVLQMRADLDADTLDAVKAVVHQRIGDDGGPLEANGGGQDFLRMDPPVDMVDRLYKARKLDDNVIGKALNAGDHAFVLAALIVRGNLDTVVVKRIFSEKSAKGILALAWRAALQAKMAVQLQQRMGRIAPSEIVTPEGDNYSLTEDEMDWQIEFFTDLCNKGTG